MHPYQELCNLLREYSAACEACDDAGALEFAMQIRDAAARLVVQAAQNFQPADPRQLELGQ